VKSASEGALVAGRYELGEPLGTGGMSTVHAAVDRRLQRPVALKRLRPEMAARADVRARFETEARWAARLSHPNAVGVFDTGEDGGIPFLVMERLPGQTLGDRLAAAHQPVDPEWLRRLALDVLGALQAAHDCGIVHRDVKPGNILLTADGRAKVADFGIAKSLDDERASLDLTRTGQLVGTPSYLAPERLDGAPADARSDVYSLAVVLYEALTGRKPFTGATPLAVAFAIKHERPVPLESLRPDVDPRFVAAVTRAMDPDPARRFPSAAAMATALGAGADDTVVSDATAILSREAVVTGMGPEAVQPTGPGGPGGVGRRAVVFAVIGVVLLLAAAMAAVLAGHGSSSPGASAADPAVAAVSGALRQAAQRLSTGDGPRGVDVAGRLRAIADEVDRGSSGAAADAGTLAGDVEVWRADGSLGTTAAAVALAALAKVPGVVIPAPPPPSTVAPVVTGGRHPKGHKHGGGD
jgi:eukaryotic-like serine/threonine-protein kinase